MIYLDLLNSAVDAEAMILMYHIISNGQIRKAGNFPAFIGFVFLFLLFLRLAEYICL